MEHHGRLQIHPHSGVVSKTRTMYRYRDVKGLGAFISVILSTSLRFVIKLGFNF